ncbi:MAG: hypothetical protein FJ313_01370, partial [Gemmatimonadetes bacterium]|nr:hypothetical protein [Gemmatimonadota bacterium]
ALPEAFEVFCGAVYAAYYADERVVRRIGWSRPRTFPAEGFDETALERVRGRPPFWRRVE